MKKYVTMKGDFFNADFEQIGIGVKTALKTCGAEASSYMKSQVDDHSVSHNLHDSIVWRMAGTRGPNRGPRADADDTIIPPSDPYQVDIGSRAEHAEFVENGSGIHKRAQGHELFIERMYEWAWNVLHIDGKNGSPEDRSHFWRVIQHIRDNPTEAQPYAKPTEDYMRIRAPKIIKSAIQTMFRKMGGKK